MSFEVKCPSSSCFKARGCECALDVVQSQTESVLGVFDSRERVHAASSADAKCGICAQLELSHPFVLHLPTIEAICF